MSEKAFAVLAKVLSYGPIKRAVVWFAKRRPYMHIPTMEDSSYMERYWIIKEGGWWANKLKLSVRLHIIKSPDQDRALHTHPFSFRTFIIDGGYMEVRKELKAVWGGWSSSYHRVAGTTYVLDKDTPHAILSLDGESAVSVFVYGPRQGDWYFDTDEGLIPQATYLNNKEQ